MPDTCYLSGDGFWSACGRSDSYYYVNTAPGTPLPHTRLPEEVTCAACIVKLPALLQSMLESADRDLLNAQLRVSTLSGHLATALRRAREGAAP